MDCSELSCLPCSVFSSATTACSSPHSLPPCSHHHHHVRMVLICRRLYARVHAHKQKHSVWEQRLLSACVVLNHVLAEAQTHQCSRALTALHSECAANRRSASGHSAHTLDLDKLSGQQGASHPFNVL